MEFIDLSLTDNNSISAFASVVTGSRSSMLLPTSHGITHSYELGLPRY
jgi:hypothetical protein